MSLGASARSSLPAAGGSRRRLFPPSRPTERRRVETWSEWAATRSRRRMYVRFCSSPRSSGGCTISYRHFTFPLMQSPCLPGDCPFPCGMGTFSPRQAPRWPGIATASQSLTPRSSGGGTFLQSTGTGTHFQAPYSPADDTSSRRTATFSPGQAPRWPGGWALPLRRAAEGLVPRPCLHLLFHRP